jgi:hypothetical protein
VFFYYCDLFNVSVGSSFIHVEHSGNDLCCLAAIIIITYILEAQLLFVFVLRVHNLFFLLHCIYPTFLHVLSLEYHMQPTYCMYYRMIGIMYVCIINVSLSMLAHVCCI